jgi:hypothetical protein
MRAITAALTCLALTALAAQVDGQIIPERPAPRHSTALRIGVLNSGLFESGQGRPLIYFDFGFRLKSDEYYVDLKLPAFVAGLDFGLFEIQRLLGVRPPFNLFNALNNPVQYAFMEPAHLRLGPTFPLAWGNPPLRASVGLFSLFDFVFFDLALIGIADGEDFEDLDSPEASDPFIIGVGGFAALGGDLPRAAWDVALGAGIDVYQQQNYQTTDGWILYTDFEVQIDATDQLGAYIRARLSTYTHTKPIVATLVLSYGAAMKLF